MFLRPNVQPMQTQFEDGPVIQLNSIDKSCLFAEVKINGVKVNFLIDTGSAVIILSSKTFELLENTPTQLGSVFNTMTAADGGIIKTYGKSLLIVISARRHWLHSKFHNSWHRWFARNFNLGFGFFYFRKQLTLLCM